MKINTCLINYLFVLLVTNFKIWNVNTVKYVNFSLIGYCPQ